MLKNIIFDWSGVVKDATECHLWVVNKIFKKFGAKEISLSELRENWEQPHMGFYNKYLPDITEEVEIEAYKQAILSGDCPKSKAYSGICEFIKKLKTENFFLGVISSDLPDTILPEIENYGLKDVFNEVIFLSSDKTTSLNRMIKRFKLNPAETFFIGDSNHEIMAGKATMVKTIAVTWGINTQEYLKAKDPDYLVHNIKELEEILIK